MSWYGIPSLTVELVQSLILHLRLVIRFTKFSSREGHNTKIGLWNTVLRY